MCLGDGMPFIYELVVIICMLFFNAIFAAYEMALASVSRARLVVLVNQKQKGAPEAVFMKDRMEASLAVVQVGITLVGAIAAATGGAGVADSLVPYFEERFNFHEGMAEFLSLSILIIPLSACTIVFAELTPKVFALNNREKICLMLSPVMKILFHVGYPVIAVLELTVKWCVRLGQKTQPFKNKETDQPGLHELTAAASLARASRLIGAREEKIVLSAAQLSVRPVREIMLPIQDVSVIPLKCTLSEALLKAHMDMHTRFPVCSIDGDSQTISGYVNFKDIMAALKLNPVDPTINGIVRPIKTVREDVPIAQVLEQMIQERLHIMLVAKAEHQIVGMITLEDIIEELVGEIEDEFDRLPGHIHPYGGGWIMGGGVPMNLVVQTAGIDWWVYDSKAGVPKLSEWCLQKLGGYLRGGETIEANGLQVTIRKLRRKKVGEAIVSVVNKPQPPMA